MTDTPTPDRDPWDELLSRGLGAQPEAAFREALWRRLGRRFQRRRWLRRLGMAAALAACYTVGLFTGYLPRVQPPSPPALQAVVPGKDGEDRRAGDGTSLSASVTGKPALRAPEPLGDRLMEKDEATASTLEWQALDSTTRRPEVYRQAADRYLDEDGDYQSAVRCYREALEEGSPGDQAIAPQDSWLLMALKEARQKEKRHAAANE